MGDGQCERKIELLEEVKAAMTELMAIQGSEVQALLADDFAQIDSMNSCLESARKRKDGLIELYRGHVASHGC
jgi:hypothetical protein